MYFSTFQGHDWQQFFFNLQVALAVNMDFLSFLEKCLAVKWRKLRADLLHGCMLEVSYTNWKWHFACFLLYGNENGLVCWFICEPFNSNKEHLSFLFFLSYSADMRDSKGVWEWLSLQHKHAYTHNKTETNILSGSKYAQFHSFLNFPT